MAIQYGLDLQHQLLLLVMFVDPVTVKATFVVGFKFTFFTGISGMSCCQMICHGTVRISRESTVSEFTVLLLLAESFDSF